MTSHKDTQNDPDDLRQYVKHMLEKYGANSPEAFQLGQHLGRQPIQNVWDFGGKPISGQGADSLTELRQQIDDLQAALSIDSGSKFWIAFALTKWSIIGLALAEAAGARVDLKLDSMADDEKAWKVRVHSRETEAEVSNPS